MPLDCGTNLCAGVLSVHVFLRWVCMYMCGTRQRNKYVYPSVAILKFTVYLFYVELRAQDACVNMTELDNSFCLSAWLPACPSATRCCLPNLRDNLFATKTRQMLCAMLAVTNRNGLPHRTQSSRATNIPGQRERHTHRRCAHTHNSREWRELWWRPDGIRSRILTVRAHMCKRVNYVTSGT